MPKHLKPRNQDGKYMVQILLPSAQGEFYVRYIEDTLKQKVSTFTKKLILKFIQDVSPDHEQLKEKDEEEWRAAVKQRVETRKKTENRLNEINPSQP
jgi:hypothetical protein